MNDEVDDSEYGHVCKDCIGEELLAKEIEENGQTAECTYCGSEDTECVTIEWLGDRIDERYRELVSFVEETPDFGDDDRVSWIQNGETPNQLITDLLEVDYDQISDDLVSYLAGLNSYAVAVDGDTDWYDDSADVYKIAVPTSARYRLAWDQFCESLKHKRRFFSENTTKVLDEILGPILRGENPIFNSALRTIGPDVEDRFVYRARPANDEGTANRIFASPIRELGAPPSHLATAGRMNSHGISVFYGSMDIKTCVAELRTPLAGQAIAGQFEIIRPLRILDLTQLRQIHNDLSYFHPDFLTAHDYANFIRGFHNEIKKTIVPGRELLEYLPTQVIAEYLWTVAEGAVDGLIFGSSQVSGGHNNIVLFPSACVVEGAELEQPLPITDTQLYGGPIGDDDYDDDYRQTVWHRPQAYGPPKPPPKRFQSDSFIDEEPEPTPVSLRLHINSLKVVRVKQIEYGIDEIPVSFYEESRFEENDPF